MSTNRIFHKVLIVAVSGIILTGCANPAELSCTASDFFAYIGADGNVYIYDWCKKSINQLTDDAYPNIRGLGRYHFYDDFGAWSPTGDSLLVSYAGVAVLINVETRDKNVLGTPKYAIWSPSGQHLALAINEGEWAKPDGGIVFMTLNGGASASQIIGNAPVWLSDEQIAYTKSVLQETGLTFTQYTNIYNIVTNESEALPAEVSLLRDVQDPIESARISTDGTTLAVYNYGQEGFRKVTLLSLPQNNIIASTIPLSDTKFIRVSEWSTLGEKYQSDAYRWSPVQPLLAICTTGGGADSVFNDTYGNALILIDTSGSVIRSDSKCLSSTQVSWSPIGDRLAYINKSGGISIIASTGRLLVETEWVRYKDATVRVDGGPWWSPDGNFIGIVANKMICIAPVDTLLSTPVFECPVEGSAMSWHP